MIFDTPENNKETIAIFDAFGVAALTNAGREFNTDGHLISMGGKSVTKTYDAIHDDLVHGCYITHPEAFRGRWSDEYIDVLIALIPDTATTDFEFIPTRGEI